VRHSPLSSPTDPNLKWKQYCDEVGSLNHNVHSNLPLLIAGEEVSCGNHLGENVHLLVMGNPSFLPGIGDGGRRWFNNKPSKTIPEVLEMIGDVPTFAAHPRVRLAFLEKMIFRRGRWHEQDLAHHSLGKKIAGLQFWNGHRKRDFSLGRAFWVQQLLNGHRLLPAGADDAHGDFNHHTGVKIPLFSLYQSMNHVFGTVRTLVQSRDKSMEQIHNGMRKGNQVCTDGPFLSLDFNDPDLTVRAKSIFSFGDLWKIHLFSGVKGDPKEKVVKSWVLETGVRDLQESVQVDKNVTYLRAEGWTFKNRLAITSPVFLNP
jgi:hypothetical protein